MKQTLLIVATFAAFFFGNVKTATAQLADGSVAPDWTLTDLNGGAHHLYEYLDNGYTVIIDFSAVWCNPCWNYHSSGALEDLYINHGPAGAPNVSATTTDDVMVFFIEGDGGTLDQLNGIGGGTQGNWVGNTPYPIISSQSQTGPYSIGYWPTVYKICPNRLTEVAGSISTAAHYAKVGECPTLLSGNDAAIIKNTNYFSKCNAGSTVHPSIIVQNAGSSTLSSLTIDVKDETGVIKSVDWNGSLESWETATVSLGAVQLNEGGDFKAEITNADLNLVNNTFQIGHVAKEIPLDFTVEVFTDNYPSETSWKIKKMSNQTVESGGPYASGPGQYGAGGADALTTKIHSVSLPGAYTCYKLELKDSQGDGLNTGVNPAGLFGMRLKVGNTVVVDFTKASSWNFGNSVIKNAAFKTSNPTAINENSINEMSISPNPVNNVATIKFDNTNDGVNNLLVVNTLGEIVINKTINSVAGNNTVELDLSNLASGVYLVTLKNGSDAVFSKIIKD